MHDLLKTANRDVVQLVVYLVWDQGVARSSRVIPTKKVNSTKSNRDVVQLVVYLVWDQGVARSSRVIPTRIRAFSSAGSEHLPYKQRVGGSNPSTPTKENLNEILFLFYIEEQRNIQLFNITLKK